MELALRSPNAAGDRFPNRRARVCWMAHELLLQKQETERQVGVIGLWGRWLEAARLEKSTIGASQAEKPYYIHAPIDTALGSRRRHRTCWALAARDRPANPSHLLPHGAVAEGAVLRHWA